jgi:hypothetical protein
MAELYGKKISREELLQYAGSMPQIAGIRRFQYQNGRQHGVKAADVRTGSGLNFTVLLDRSIDIAYADYCGKPLSWVCKNGIVAPQYFENGGIGFLRTFSGGLTTTVGLTQAGEPGIDGDEVLGIHGRISHIPAETYSVHEDWEGDEYVMRIRGQMRETCLYAENMVLKREITCKLGESVISIKDTVENQGYNDTPFMLLYHVNFGYPVVSEHSRLYSSAERVEPWNDAAKTGNGKYDRFERPQKGYQFQNFTHYMPRDKDLVLLGIVNEELSFGGYLEYSPKEMPCFNEWKMMGQQDYVVGLEPGINIPEGRLQARENNRLAMLKPGESRNFNYRIGVLPDQAAIDTFIRRF